MRPDEPLISFDWVARNLDQIAQRTGEHIVMTLLAVAVGFVISFLLALLLRRSRSLYAPVLAVSGVLYTIPSLALFALLIPIAGLSLLSAEIALISYTVLILVRNIVAGLEAVPADVSEAATAMGYTGWQRLWGIELPIAVPVIVAGLRIATVTTIGLVTVTSLIGQGGLGYFIVVVGIRQFFPTAIYVGAFLSIALAIVADLALLALQRGLTPWTRARTANA
jgi:osmoprotectant transport system permease protein